ncbi:MAG TPA: uracil-DNA glycosylase [Chloroflexi bacterium]|nr:uracil-DNA glycosylase [Chloroflexota bacterium]
MSELDALATEIARCTKCLLHQGRTRTVPGEGRDDADVMFVGEAPGFYEDQQGRPFVGAAGKFLDELLDSIGLKRGDVFIANVIKCRPPGNRDPLPEEIAACKPYLDRQIALIQPKIIVTLGRFSMARAFPKARISQIHGQPRKVDGIIYYPMYHPAAALHQPSLRQTVVDDMRRIPQIIAQASHIAEFEPTPEAEQLKLF